jgi:molecular chaperone GrpE
MKEAALYTQKDMDAEKRRYADLEAECQKTAAAEAKWKNDYYLSLADTQNLRKSLEADHREALRYRSEGFLENLLPALDSFFIALEARPQSPEAQNYQQGFSFIYNQIQNVLLSEGVSEVVPKIGDRFDATLMHAVDIKDDAEDGKVLQVYAKGYKLHDRLIRPAMVCVSKKKADPQAKVSEASKA